MKLLQLTTIVRDAQTGDDDGAVVHALSVLVGRQLRQSAPAGCAHRVAAARRLPVLEGRRRSTSTTRPRTAATSTASASPPNRPDRHPRLVGDLNRSRRSRSSPACIWSTPGGGRTIRTRRRRSPSIGGSRPIAGSHLPRDPRVRRPTRRRASSASSHEPVARVGSRTAQTLSPLRLAASADEMVAPCCSIPPAAMSGSTSCTSCSASCFARASDSHVFRDVAQKRPAQRDRRRRQVDARGRRSPSAGRGSRTSVPAPAAATPPAGEQPALRPGVVRRCCKRHRPRAVVVVVDRDPRDAPRHQTRAGRDQADARRRLPRCAPRARPPR